MSIDLEALFQAFDATVGKPAMADAEFGETFRRMMAALVRFDYVVVFAYRGKERPIDLYSTFDPQENVVFVTLYQVGPYLLDPSTRPPARVAPASSACASWRPTASSPANITGATMCRPGLPRRSASS